MQVETLRRAAEPTGPRRRWGSTVHAFGSAQRWKALTATNRREASVDGRVHLVPRHPSEGFPHPSGWHRLTRLGGFAHVPNLGLDAPVPPFIALRRRLLEPDGDPGPPSHREIASRRPRRLKTDCGRSGPVSEHPRTPLSRHPRPRTRHPEAAGRMSAEAPEEPPRLEMLLDQHVGSECV